MALVPLRVKKVQTPDRVLQQMQDALEDLAKQVSVHLGGSTDVLPIGSVIGVHVSKKSTPTIAANGSWAPMNGQTLHDADSPYDGQVIEDWNGSARFLRGGATSGVLQAADTLIPDHTHVAPPVKLEASSGGSTHAFANLTPPAIVADANAVAEIGGFDGPIDTIPAGGASGVETRPINASVVWYLKVK